MIYDLMWRWYASMALLGATVARVRARDDAGAVSARTVSAALYGLLAAALAVLVSVGVIDDSTSAAIATAAAAVVAAVIEVVKAGGLRNAVAAEPVRTAVYTAGVAILLALVAAGVIDDGTSAVVAGILGALLVGGTETARSVVVPVAKVRPETNLS